MRPITQRRLTLGLGLAVTLALAPAAFAHPGGASSTHPMLDGLLHPLLGPDHLMAMFASGLLAVRIGTRRALWAVPLSFMTLMLLGGVVAALGVPLPHAEWAISLSVIVLGLAVAMTRAVPLSIGAALVGAFAFCHGHAHVAELGSAALLPFMAGFTLTTLALHVAAIAAGVVALRNHRPGLVRIAGVGIATTFALLLMFFTF